MFWFRYAQKFAFAPEIRALSTNSPLSRSSPLRALHPFVDENALLRLGGRLQNAALSYDEQHLIILPRDRVAELLIQRAHKATLHGGTQLVIRTLRQRHCIIRCRKAVKSHIRACVTCTRYSALPCSQLMGNLPASRVNPSPPFDHTGVDYAGPFNVLPLVGRGQKTRKNYVALFICLATRAVHLELVEDYSADGFLAAFRRFSCRRRLPRWMYSDDGTNFHGADRELQRQFHALKDHPEIRDVLAADGVEWEFVPSAAPHFGGLWEAGVKSFKAHLKRVVGARTISRAGFATLLCQIEACLNSRPIAALSDDPSDMSALTPGHFLIGRPMIAVSEESVFKINPDRLSCWQLVSSMREQFWRAWSHDYLLSLQTRTKWRDAAPNLEVGDLVIVKNPLLPPSKWELARIQQVHPGSDGLVRVVTIRTARSLLKRPITQLYKLPVSCKTSASESD
ncbi:PREDICTED: uncharacterized protein LOC108759170 [Trachymyrmex cornetzi]|uniref:uncharacterized protein LOC108759170 n=1 Tax=Trachymyrmex cornetzi TaxID=471704 RepID=UPI00084F61DA|nr:PREDICTED: uncharacterized protein LOC108759170 [Trachymyrmex cornetzi]